MAKRATFRKVITTPELIEQINPKNKKLFDRFLRNFATTHSPKSVEIYRSNFNIWGVWNLLYNDNEFFVDVRKLAFLDFFDFCVIELHHGSNRFAQLHSTLCSLSTFIEDLLDEEYPNFRNVVKKIKKPVKETVRKKTVFKREELFGLLKWLGDVKNKPQEQCLLALLMYSGSRIAEAPRFRVDIIDENNTAFDDLFIETLEEIQVKGRGVNGKKLYRYILKDPFMPYYKKWLVEREKIMKENNQNHQYLFIKSNGEPATKSTLCNWMEKWDNCEALNGKHLYAHSLRHFMVSENIRIGVDPKLIQEIHGWCSSDLVDLYTDLTAKERKWKGLDKLRASLDALALQDEIDDVLNNENEQE